MIKWMLLLVILFAIPLPVPAPAGQGQQSPQRFIQFREEVIDPALEEQYERGVRGLAESVRQAKVSPEWNWETSYARGSYYYLFPIPSLDVLDEKTAAAERRASQLLSGIGMETYLKWGTLYYPAVRAYRTSVLERMDALSYQPANSIIKQPKFVFVEMHRVRSDMREPYRAVINRYLGAMRSANYPIGWTAYRTVVGEMVNYYFTPLERLSQLTEQTDFSAGLVKALGKDGFNKLHYDLRKCLTSLEDYTATLRPDLSYRAETTIAQ